MNSPAVVSFHCACGRVLKTRAEHAGRSVACPSCRKNLVIPSGTAQKAPPTARSIAEPPLPRSGNQRGVSANDRKTPGVNFPAPPSHRSSVGKPPGPIPGPNPASVGGQRQARPVASNGAPPSVGDAGGDPAAVSETCPGCGSFFPRAQPTCTKCRWDRVAGKKVPYQNMVQQVKMAPKPVVQEPRKTKSLMDSQTMLYLFGGLALTFVGLGVFALMVALMANADRVRIRIFIIPVSIMGAGIGLMLKSLNDLWGV